MKLLLGYIQPAGENEHGNDQFVELQNVELEGEDALEDASRMFALLVPDLEGALSSFDSLHPFFASLPDHVHATLKRYHMVKLLLAGIEREIDQAKCDVGEEIWLYREKNKLDNYKFLGTNQQEVTWSINHMTRYSEVMQNLEFRKGLLEAEAATIKLALDLYTR